MASARLPVELWEQILEESISPTFLDPECLPEIMDPLYRLHRVELGDDQEYWETERHRNNLQRVCKSWDQYLRPFEHRLVRFCDITHGIVPKQALRTAIRISFKICPNFSGFCTLGEPPDELDERGLLPLIEELGDLSVEILDIGGRSITHLPVELQKAFIKMPRLQVVLKVDVRLRMEARWARVISFLPNLRFLTFKDIGQDILWPVFRAKHLTTLSYGNSRLPFLLPLHECALPSLQHLRFTQLPFNPFELSHQIWSLVRTISSVGHNLRSLQLGIYGPAEVAIPKEIWDLCPRLERLDCGLCFDHSPSPNHPLHTISVYMPFESELEKTGPRFPPSLIGSFPLLKRLILQNLWNELEELIVAYDCKTTYSQVMDLAYTCRRYDVALVDFSGAWFRDSGLEKLVFNGHSDR